MNQTYYQLELDDVATPSFVSFGKFYWGTMDELRGFINALRKAEYVKGRCNSLIEAFEAYEKGQTDITHNVAFREVPLLRSAVILHEEKSIIKEHSWTHLNIWNYPQELRCRQVETRHLWVQCENRFFRVVYAYFTELEHLGITDQWRKVGEMLWGYPEILDYQPPYIYNRLAEPELAFDSIEALQADWQAFRKLPNPIFDEFCNDIFADG